MIIYTHFVHVHKIHFHENLFFLFYYFSRIIICFIIFPGLLFVLLFFQDYYLFYLCLRSKPETCRAMWGEELVAVDDVHHVFECYITGEKNKNGVKVRRRYYSLSLPYPFAV